MSSNHVWFDLVTTDPAAGLAFYKELIGYGSESWTGGSEPYEMFTIEGRGFGGVMALPEQARQQGAPPHWLGYVGVDDLDATLSRVAALGGSKIMGPQEVPGAGRFAMAADPQGAVFAMFQSTSPSEPREKPRVGDVSWCELMTTDMEAALGFYGELFGWRKTEAMDMGEGWMYQMFGSDRTIGGAMNKGPDMADAPTAWLYYIHVADVKATCDKAVSLGATLLNGPMAVPGGDLVAQLLDPQGATFAVHGPAA